jgi:hypothetical protein
MIEKGIINIEKKGLIWGTIWGLISIVYTIFINVNYNYIESINPILFKLTEYTINLPISIIADSIYLIFGDATRKLSFIIIPLYLIGAILVGMCLGYLISKIIKEMQKKSKELTTQP